MRTKLQEAGCNFLKGGEGLDAKWFCIMGPEVVAISKSLGDCIKLAAGKLGE